MQAHQLLAVLLLAGPGLATAANSGVPCGEKFTTPEINECLGKASSDIELELQQAVERLASKLTQIDREGSMFKPAKTFLKAQELWRSHRDTECQAKSETMTYGTAAPAQYTRCVLAMTKSRIEALNPDIWFPR